LSGSWSIWNWTNLRILSKRVRWVFLSLLALTGDVSVQERCSCSQTSVCVAWPWLEDSTPARGLLRLARLGQVRGVKLLLLLVGMLPPLPSVAGTPALEDGGSVEASAQEAPALYFWPLPALPLLLRLLLPY